MFCSVCGKDYDDSLAACPVCGAINNNAPQTAEATVSEPTVGAFESVPPVVPQPAVEAPVAQPVAAPVAPQPEFQAPVEVQPAVVATAPAKKSKKPVIIGAVAVLIVAIIAVVLVLIVPKITGKDDGEASENKAGKGETESSVTYEVDSPLGGVSDALEKTLFENSGMEFSIRTDYREYRGAVSFGDTGRDSGFYMIDSEGIGFGLADYVYYDSSGVEDPMPDGWFDEGNEKLDYYGFDIDIEGAIDGILNNKIDRDALAQFYNDNRADFEEMVSNESGTDVTLPEFDDIQQFFADFVNEGITEDAISITEEKDGDYTVYELEINIAEFTKCIYDYAKNDSEVEGILTLIGMVFGGSGSDYIGVIGDIIDYYEYDLYFEVEAEIVVNKDGYIKNLDFDVFGEEVEIELSNFNSVEVTLDVLKEEIAVDDDYYGSGVVAVQPDVSYDDYYYNCDAWIGADTYDVYLETGDTLAILVECWGTELPSTFEFNVDVPDGVSISWGDWETDTSCYLYVTGESYCSDYMTVTLQDEYGNVYDSIGIYIDIY